jgi:hypothetical protein
MRLPNYSRLRLVTDRHRPEGVDYGAVGYIIEVYSDADYEVEFSDDQGITVAQIVVRGEELELDEPPGRGGLSAPAGVGPP